MKVEIRTVTPKQAQKMLDDWNIENRKVRPNHINWLSGQIERGEFLLTHQGIAFTESGRLVDGQHRLMAIVKANKPTKMLVATELDEDVFKVIDCGENRSLADRTHLDKRVTEVLRPAVSALKSADLNNHKATATELLDLDSRGWGEQVARLHSFSPSRKAMNAACFRLAACVAVQMTGDEEAVFNLFRKMNLLMFDELPPLANAFMRQLTSGGIDATRKRKDAYCRALKVLTAKDKSAKKLILTDDERDELWRETKAVLRGGA